jgi:hypothetical protein
MVAPDVAVARPDSNMGDDISASRLRGGALPLSRSGPRH